MCLILCKNLTLGYEGKEIVKELSFKVDKGQYLCIIGENGAGKTTLMRGLLGLHKPLGGEIIFGEDLRQNQIGYIPQQSTLQKDFPATVMEVVLSGCLNMHGKIAIYNRGDKALAVENMDKLGILPLKNKCYSELSGGQQQRVLMARALCATKRVIVLDEPMAGLDPETAKSLYKLLRALNDEGITILMISHDIEGVLEHASHILELCKDRTFFGSREAYTNV